MVILLNSNTFAQSFQEGDVIINAGLGVGSTYSWTCGFGIPLGAGLEYGVTDLEVGSIGVRGGFRICIWQRSNHFLYRW